MKRRESRYVKVARIAFRLAKEALPQYNHPKSRHTYSLQQLAAGVLLMFYLDKSYRDMEEWLLTTDQVVQVLQLAEVHDHSTLQRTYNKLRVKHFDKMNQQLLAEVGLEPEETIAADSTGFSPSQASLHYLTQTGRKFTAWVKGAYAVGTRSQFILAWRYGRGSIVAGGVTGCCWRTVVLTSDPGSEVPGVWEEFLTSWRAREQ